MILSNVFVFWDGCLHGGIKLLLVLLHGLIVNVHFGWRQGGASDELQIGVSGETLGQPHEGLLKVVVRLGRDIVVLQVLLAVEGDVLGLDLALLDVNLVAAEDDWNVLTDARQIFVPVGNVLVGDATGDIEHDDTALPLNVVAVAQAAELLLPGRVPNVKADWSVVGMEKKRMHLNTHRGNVPLLKLTAKMALHKGRLASTTVAYQN